MTTEYLDNVEVEEEINKYQILISNITWNKNTIGKFQSKKDFSKSLPEQFSYVLPPDIAKHENDPDFYDKVETHIYNFLTHRFNHEVYHCNIFLPTK